ncbi:hypothetical protein Pst134EA_009597 [Puccinia striiformis f. sp. tritici]|uniref:hypothetical protein n=1 Tax=Puccinia striiformis f. sp. tritici TaxID=168172 RepID=UPI002007D3EF|nr:hypothetical protein Pst134EA_009597 [Puccinia striiformis f. sp. tritici]KAH9469074.1 hypothetical protein Pst134EA_009597 [Puccinia striiformis f. sp. tritici]
MELDAITQSVRGRYFGWGIFKQTCKDNSLCVRCAGDFDEDHQAARGCILPEKDQLDEEQAKSLWVQWGGALRDNSAPAQSISKWSPEFCKTRGSSAPATPFVCGKKRESISEMTSKPAAKKNGGQISPTASSSESLFDDSPLPVPVIHGLASMSAVPVTVGEYLFERQVMDIDDSACKQSFCVERSSLFSNRPFFDGKLALQKQKLTNVSVLVDSGASTSFIDSEFVQKNNIVLHKLSVPLQEKSFDGAMARSGDIVDYVKGTILVPIGDEKKFTTTVQLYVTKISSANIILGSTWLQAADTIIGGG